MDSSSESSDSNTSAPAFIDGMETPPLEEGPKMPFSRFSLPGLNLPLNWTPRPARIIRESVGTKVTMINDPATGEGQELFSTALNAEDSCALPLTTLRELTMLQIMNALTDKPGWEEKIFDDTIAEKWKAEAISTEGRDVTPKMMDWCIAELRYKVKRFKKTGAVTVYNGDVVKSDVAIPETLKQSLIDAALKLENIPEVYKDYHPGSDEKVLDLVHPSLFPLVYGQTRVLEDSLIGLNDCIESCGKGIVVQIRPDEETELGGDVISTGGYRRWNEPPPPYSKIFQWLPCEVDISGDDDDKVKITSYINNLHPQKHQDLYSTIEKVINRVLPLWNMTLTPLRDLEYWQRIDFDLRFDPDPDDMAEEDKPQQGDDEDDNTFWDRYNDWEQDTRKTVLPDAEDFSRPLRPLTSVDLKKDYGSRGLQIIVKLANIELSPEKPSYEGGTWHVEGQLNEHICATALYYYDCSNITESRLAFRQQSRTDDAHDMSYPQNVNGWLVEVFGCRNEEAAVQEVGSVLCKEGRLLTFPNILQHQVQPFELADKTKKGHRKILALFLVDPGIRVISTANVPPQQRDWWSEEVSRQFSLSGKALGKLSAELKDKVFSEVDEFPLSMETAKELRLKLMEERKVYVTKHERAFEKETFSLCEH